jgi:hypothetical protein
MKRLIMMMFVITLGAGLYAQNSFFPTKAGMVLLYANNDAKGNLDGHTMMTIKDVKGSGNNMTITYVGSGLDKSRKAIKDSSVTYTVVIKNGVVFMDVNQLVPPELKAQGMKMEAKGTSMELPSDLKPGQSLKPYEITLTMDLGVMKVNSTVRSVGKCLAIEDVKVPAGTFKCHKITQTITTTAMNINTVTTAIDWIAPGIGQIKSESYDDKKKLVYSTVLVEIKGK